MKNEEIDLSKISEKELLNMRIKDLPLNLEKTWIKQCVDELYSELDGKNIVFRPPCYLADEWLTPDGEPVVGIPFFLAHPSLIKLEKKMMLDVEGGTKSWCMKLLRHETGHAINYAYKLHKKKKWRKYFGSFSADYPDTYRFRRYSRSFVRHLEDYYAQYHPDEDFAETFAVWLTPGLDWQKKYKGWKALDKLLCVEELMNGIKGKEPFNKQGKKYWDASRLSIKLANYYRKKKRFWAEYFPDFHDANLKRIFRERENDNEQYAAAIIKKYRKDILESVSLWTGEKKYVINDLLQTITGRCSDLRLTNTVSETLSVVNVAVYVTALIMNYLHTGKFRGER